MKTIIDANVILRYLLDDDKDMADMAEKIIMNGAKTLPEVLAEVVYVLSGVYKMQRSEVSECLFAIIDIVDIDNKEIMNRAIEIYNSKNLDFVDCILIANNHVKGEDVFSFDKKLNRELIKLD